MKHGVTAQFQAASVNTQARTVDVAFYTGAVVRRSSWDGDYEMVVDFDGMDIAELNDGTAPVLNDHGRDGLEDVLGHVVEGSVRIEPGDMVGVATGVSYRAGTGFATLAYAATEDIEPLWQRVAQGAARKVSMGFRILETVTISRAARTDGGTADLVIVRKSAPYEISPVPLGADPSARTLAAEPDEDVIVTKPVTKTSEDLMTDGVQPTTVPEPAAAPSKDAFAAEFKQRLSIARQAAAVARITDADAVEALALDHSLDEAGIRSRIVEMAAARQQPIGGESRVEPGTDGAERMAEAIEGAIYRRIDPGLYSENYREVRGGREDAAETERMRRVLSAGRDLSGRSVMELARMSLESRGWKTSGMGRETMARVALAFSHTLPEEQLRNAPRGERFAMSSSDFPKVLQNIATKRLITSYENAPAFYQDLCWRYDVPNFREFALPRRGDIPAPLLIKEGGEYKRRVIGEGGETNRASKKGMILAFTWEAMINDDIGAFQFAPMDIADAFRAEEQDSFIELVVDNTTTMADGVVPYHVDYHTLTSTAAAPSADSADLMRSTLASQRGINGKDGNPKSLRLFAVLGPETLGRGLAANFGPLGNVPDSTANQRNPMVALPLNRIYTDARLSGTAYYGFADPNVAFSIAYGFLQGEPPISTETQASWLTDGMEVKARRVMHLTRAARPGIVKNAG